VLEKGGEDQLYRLCEERSITQPWKEQPTYNKMKVYAVLLSRNCFYSTILKEREEEKTRKKK
jgi:hypothetical protein